MARLTKICCRCKQEKSVVGFHKNKQQKDGFHVYCADCHNWLQKNKWFRDKERVRKYKKVWMSNGGEDINRDWQYRHKYSITLEDYNKLFVKQNGCCNICDKHQSEISRRLSVEHCHKTGRVRGLTCHHCNRKLTWYEQYEKEIKNHLRKNK